MGFLVPLYASYISWRKVGACTSKATARKSGFSSSRILNREADDILGTLAKKAQAQGMEVSLVSGDRDLLQVADEHIKIRIPKTKMGRTEVEDYYPEDVVKAFQRWAHARQRPPPGNPASPPPES